MIQTVTPRNLGFCVNVGEASQVLQCLAWVFRVCGTVLGTGRRGRVLSRESTVRKRLGLGAKGTLELLLREAPRLCARVRLPGAGP